MTNKLVYLGAAALGGAALLATSTLPASAAPTGGTVTTFALIGGSLNIAVQGTATVTGGDSGATTATGQLGQVVVNDGRGVAVGGWTTSASSTAFSNATTSSTAVTYGSGTPTKTGRVTATSSGTVPLTTAPAAVVVGTLVVGNNTATWNPTLTVTLPPDSTAGTYTGTVTTSVA